MATVHSHAFQRALRGRTQRRANSPGSFWSWRDLMYTLAARLDPDDMYHIAHFAFVELTMSGVTAVGEFHYIHHAPDGTPYADRLTMADAVIHAAHDAGIRLTLLRTAYFQAGPGEPPTPIQRRFCDATVDQVCRDVEALAQRYVASPLVHIGVAAHSLRAVTRPQLGALATYARSHTLPFHMHVAEQPREVDICLGTYGMRPVMLLADDGILDERFVAVHATHLTPEEMALLGAAQAFICLCRTTERDLGDGLPDTTAMVRAGVTLCVGVDSHTSGDAFEELRAVEYDERSRTLTRHAAVDAPVLLAAATRQGYAALGLGPAWQHDQVYLNAHDASIAGSSDALLTDSVIFGATPRTVDEVVIAGRPVVQHGIHVYYEAARSGYETTLRKLGLL
jgi:formiminoglutamate deiminase